MIKELFESSALPIFKIALSLRHHQQLDILQLFDLSHQDLLHNVAVQIPWGDGVEEDEGKGKYFNTDFDFRYQDEIDRDVLGPCRLLRLHHKVSSLHSLRLLLHRVHQLHGRRCQWLQRHSGGRHWA